MKILAFETASGRCSAAISDSRNILSGELLTENSQQAENLTSMIEKVLTKTNLTLHDMNYIAVTNGPGSFTGIRIGLAALLGLTFSTNIEPLVVSNFEIINYRIREQIRNFDYSVTLIDAYRNEIYIEIFDKNNKSVYGPSLETIDKIKDVIRGFKGQIACAGSGAIKIQELAYDNISILPRFPFPDARIICKLAASKILKGNFSSTIEALYIRQPDAKKPVV